MTKPIPQPVNQTAPSPHELMRQTQREIAEAVMQMKAKQIECLIGLYKKSDALKIDLNGKTYFGYTAFPLACNKGPIELIEMLMNL